MRELISNKYYILTVTAVTLVLLLAILLHGCNNNDDHLYSSSDDDTQTSSSDSSDDVPNDETRLHQIMDSDIKNDSSVIAAVPFSVNTFGEYSTVIEKSGTYKFNAVNIDGTDDKVSWNIYAFDKPYKFGTNQMLSSEKPSAVTDSNLTLYKGQYLYCICSVNQYNYENTNILSYLKVRLINEIDDSLHTEHKHNFEEKTVVEDCEKSGYIIYECSCGESYIESVKPTEHDYEITETKPTCTKDGFKTYTCKKCNHTYEEPTSEKATGHICDNSNIHVTPDKHEFTCTVCKEKIAEMHTFVKTALITAMTDNNGNIKYYSINIRNICSVCKYSASVDSPDITHTTSSYKYDKNTETLTFNCDDCGTRSYKCTVYLDYEIIDDNSSEDTSSSSSSSSSDFNSSHK